MRARGAALADKLRQAAEMGGRRRKGLSSFEQSAHSNLILDVLSCAGAVLQYAWFRADATTFFAPGPVPLLHVFVRGGARRQLPIS